MRFSPRLTVAAALAAVLLCFTPARAWHDETHLAVAKAAGYAKWYNAAGADMAKLKAEEKEQLNHYFNNSGAEVTPELVLAQVERYNRVNDPEGHLYGAIIASLRDYEKAARQNKYAEYHLAFCAHYLGDLSQPLHNTPYDEFNRSHHGANDGIVDHNILNRISWIEKNMHPVTLRRESFEQDLAREISRIANSARKLGLRLRAEKRDMTPDEAFIQLGQSASLLEAVLNHYRR